MLKRGLILFSSLFLSGFTCVSLSLPISLKYAYSSSFRCSLLLRAANICITCSITSCGPNKWDPLESWWARKVSTLLVGIETTTPPHPQPSEGCSSSSLGALLRRLPLTHTLLGTQLERECSPGHDPWALVASPSSAFSCWLLLGPWHWLHLEPALLPGCPLQLSPRAAQGRLTWHAGSRTLLLCQLYFKRRINPDPVTPLWWVQRAVSSLGQLPFGFLHFMALPGSNSVIMFIFPYKS